MDEAINQHILYLELINDPDYHDITDFKIFGNYANIPKCELLETCDEIYNGIFSLQTMEVYFANGMV